MLAKYPRLQNISDQNLLFWRIVGVNGIVTDPHFKNWDIEPLTPNSILPFEVVKQIYLVNSAGYQITGGVILHEPKKKHFPWVKVVVAGGIAFMGAVTLFTAIAIGLAILMTIGKILMAVAPILAIVAFVLIADPVYIVQLSDADGTMLEIYSHV